MKKLLFSLMISWLLVFALSFSAPADVLYTVSDLENSSKLGLINKDSSGNLTDNIILSGLSVSSAVFSFKHNGQDRVLLIEGQDDIGTNKISVYDPADFSKVLATGTISTKLMSVYTAAEFGNNLILAGDGVNTDKGAIVEINPDTCAVVNQFEFGSVNAKNTISNGQNDNFARLAVNNGKIYATFGRNVNGTYTFFTVEADSVSNLSEAYAKSSSFPVTYNIRSLNNNLYLGVHSDKPGLYKVNSLSSIEKFISDETLDFDTDGSSGFYYTTWSGGYARYLSHWDGTASKKIYDVGEVQDLTSAYSELGLITRTSTYDSVKYDSTLKTIFSLKCSKENSSANTWSKINLLAISPEGQLLKEISGYVNTFAVVESASLNKDDDDDGDSDKEEKTITGSSSGGGCSVGAFPMIFGILAVAFFKKH